MKSVKWERKPLGTVADLCLGKMLDQKKNRGEALPYLANVNVRWGEFTLDDLRTMRFEPNEMDRYGLKFGDIVMCEGGEPGRCAIWKDQVFGMMIQKAIHRIRPKELLDYRFLFYSFLHIGRSKGFDQYFTGATIKHLPGEKLAKVEVEIPPLPVQQRIAGILSAYDELIENSQRRIKILEAMSRSLYREWFVHLRFPGHDSHPRVASPFGDIPRGWEVRKLGMLADIRWGDTSTTKASYVDEGYAAYSASGLDGKLDHYDFDRLGIVLSAIGAQCGKTWLARGKWSCIKNTIRFWAKNEFVSTEFLFIATVGQDFWPRRGAAQPFISQGDAEQIKILVPDSATLKHFTTFAAASLKNIAALETQIQNLRHTRDLLLPRLLSGQIALHCN